MSRDDNTRLRITLWPYSPLPLPPSQGGIRAVFHPEARAFLPDWESGLGAAQEFTGETYLRFAALDPEDIEGIEQFTRDYGELGVRGQFDPVETEWDAFAISAASATGVLAAEYERAVEVAGPQASAADTLIEFQWAILFMRDLVSAWLAVNDKLDPTQHRWECPLWSHQKDPVDSPPWTREGPAVLLHLALSSALLQFGPQVRTVRPGNDGAPDAPIALFSDVSCWHALCLELFNHMVEGAKYKTCANEACGRLFVRQQGRALHGQHRTSGVKYCSSSCARAQAQRGYRRRQHQG